MSDSRQPRLSLAQRVGAAALSGPPTLLRKLAGPPVFNDLGWQMHLPTQVLATLESRFETMGMDRSDAVKMRRQSDLVMGLGMPRRTDVSATDRRIPGPAGTIPVRVYEQLPRGEQRPAVVYFHGGGWVVGNLDTHDGTCRAIAALADCVVISVDYRLAPEHPFPAAPDDCLAAYAWVHEQADELGLDPQRIGVAGDSAGGNLAAVVTQQAGRHGLPLPKVQCLVYPATDMSFDSESHRLFARGFVLSRASMEFFRAAYSADPRDWTDPRMAPIRADELGGLSPALIYTAGFDPLRDEGQAYGDALQAAGVSVLQRCYHDRIHGFFGMGIFPGTMEIIGEICGDLRDALSR